MTTPIHALAAGPQELTLVGGERVKRQDTIWKKWASRIGNGVRKRLLKDTCNDTGCGIKAMRRDAFLRLLDSARTLLFPLYASLLTPWWLRALGAKIGRDVEASTVLLLPKMTTVGEGAFLADDTMIASYELGGGWLHVAAAKVGKRAFLGNSGMTAPGRAVPDRGLVGVLSATPKPPKTAGEKVTDEGEGGTKVAEYLVAQKII